MCDRGAGHHRVIDNTDEVIFFLQILRDSGRMARGRSTKKCAWGGGAGVLGPAPGVNSHEIVPDAIRLTP